MDTKKGSNRKNKLNVAAACLVVFMLVCAVNASAYNWPWDQGHDCVETVKGSGNWGKWDYDGKFAKNTYSSKECCELYCKVCPVYANTGRYQKTFTDLTVPGVGPALEITRTYNSQEWSSTLMGYSWTFNFGRKLIITRNKAGEKLVGVLLKTGEKNYYREDQDGELTRITEYGADYVLIKNDDNTYAMQYKNGTWYELREDGKIAKIIDRNQNELVFAYNLVGCLDRITNASGNYVDFQLGANGKVASVSDNLGRTVAYGYDDNGNLTSVTDPLGNKVQYVYNSKNYLVRIIDARGNTVESVEYDDNQPPRVSKLEEKGEQFTIAYFDGRTEKSDSSGNKWTYYYNDSGVIQKVVDPLGNERNIQLNKVTATSVDWEEDLNGNRTSYTYDTDGNVTSRTDPLGNAWVYTYVPGTDLLASETAPTGEVTKYEYDQNGNKVREVRDFGGPLENVVSFTYDSRGFRTGMTDPLGNRVFYEYDERGNLLKEIDALGNINSYTYDVFGNTLTATGPEGSITTYSYDLLGRLLSVVDTLGRTATNVYDANGNVLREVESNGNTRNYVYDAHNRLVQEYSDSGGPLSYTYDSLGNRSSVRDAGGNTTFYTHDINGRLIREIDAAGKRTTFEYDLMGNIIGITDANDLTTSFTYDQSGRKTSETSGAGETTTYEYDANGKLIAVILPNGNTVTYRYDSLGRLLEKVDGLGRVAAYTYDLVGNLLTVIDGLGETISFEYDANGQLTQRTDALGHVTRYTYDGTGKLLMVTEPDGKITRYTYDALSRRVTMTGPEGNVTAYAYDNADMLSTLIDANGNTTRYVYDKAGRITQKIYADGTGISYVYNAVGTLKSMTDALGKTANYSYDKLNRLTRVDYSDGTYSEFVYDSVGNLLAAHNQDFAVTFTYDSAYRLVQSTQNGQTVRYEYDAAGNTKSIIYPNGKIVREYRNHRGFLTRLENGSGELIVSYDLDGADRLLRLTYGHGITAALTRNANGWLTEILYRKDDLQLKGLRYGHDGLGFRVYKEKLNDPARSESYAYDARKQMVAYRVGQLVGIEIPVPLSEVSYDFDPLGNWNGVTRDGATEQRQHNRLNQLVGKDGGAFVYDANGNLLDDGQAAYTYNAQNSLIRVTRKSDNGVLAEYRYDALGRRAAKVTYGADAGEFRYLYDGRSFLLLAELDASNSVLRTYTWGADLSGMKENLGGIGGLVKMETVVTDQESYYHHDANGNIIMLTDGQSARVTVEYGYSPFGEPTGASGPDAQLNPFRFSTKYFDSETGLYYYGYRYYDPVLGRWISRDPVEEFGGMNLYAFVANNPVNYFDMLGLWLGSGHENITEDAWALLSLPTEMRKYSSKILDLVVTENRGIDSGDTGDNVYWHFNRGINENIAPAIRGYKNNIIRSLQRFDTLISFKTSWGCTFAIEMLGKLSHAWQDYYAHGIALNSDGMVYIPGGNTIGNIAGNPDSISSAKPQVKPSSWGGIFNPGEHKWTEPGWRAPDYASRVRQSRNFTKNKFKTYIKKWWNSCECFIDRVVK